MIHNGCCCLPARYGGGRPFHMGRTRWVEPEERSTTESERDRAVVALARARGACACVWLRCGKMLPIPPSAPPPQHTLTHIDNLRVMVRVFVCDSARRRMMRRLTAARISAAGTHSPGREICGGAHVKALEVKMAHVVALDFDGVLVIRT